MSALIDLTGRQFGRLTVLERATGDSSGLTRWRCVCVCGAERVVRGQDLRRGRQVSCGCLRDANTSARDYKHGQSGTRLHRIWKGMKSRCYNPRVPSYKDYGARGIAICPEWRDDFSAFREWALANEYSDEKSIDRIDVNRGYTPDNCRWATRAEQSRNTRVNHRINTPWGPLCLKDAAARAGISLSALKVRIKKGVPEDQLLRKEARPYEGTT